MSTFGKVSPGLGSGATGTVIGPGSSTDGDIATFNGTSGTLIKDSGVNITSLVVSPTANSLLTIRGFDPSTAVNASGLTIRGGNSSLGPTTVGGSLTINAGSSNNASAASVTISGGVNTSATGTAGSIILGGGSSSGATGVGGAAILRSGRNTSTGTSGALTLRTGNSASGDIRLTVDHPGNVAIGVAALATTATDGFLYIPSSAGIPTGVPTAKTGLVPLSYDSTNSNFYIYNASWKKVGNVNQLGNSFGTSMSIGTNDANTLSLRSNNVVRLVLDSTKPALQVPDSDVVDNNLGLNAGSGVTNGNGGTVTIGSGDGVGNPGGNIYLNTGVGDTGSPADNGIIEFYIAGNATGRFSGTGTFELDNAVDNTNTDPIISINGNNIFVPNGSTNNATPTVLATYTTTTDTTRIFTLRMTGRRSGTNDSASFILNKMIKNSGGTVTISTIVADASFKDTGALTWACSLQVSGTNITVQVTGQSSATLGWSGYLEMTT